MTGVFYFSKVDKKLMGDISRHACDMMKFRHKGTRAETVYERVSSVSENGRREGMLEVEGFPQIHF